MRAVNWENEDLKAGYRILFVKEPRKSRLFVHGERFSGKTVGWSARAWLRARSMRPTEFEGETSAFG